MQSLELAGSIIIHRLSPSRCPTSQEGARQASPTKNNNWRQEEKPGWDKWGDKDVGDRDKWEEPANAFERKWKEEDRERQTRREPASRCVLDCAAAWGWGKVMSAANQPPPHPSLNHHPPLTCARLLLLQVGT